MPEGSDLCRKCRAGFCQVGDTWCRLCSSASALGELAKVRFAFDSHRALGEEIIVQAVRNLKALTEVDKQTNSQVVSLSDRLTNAQERTAVAKRSASRPAVSGVVKRERSPSRERAASRRKRTGPSTSPRKKRSERRTIP